MGSQWKTLRTGLMEAYDSVHALTLTKSFYGDYPDDNVWTNRKLWLHPICSLFSEFSFLGFELYNFVTNETFFEALQSLTICAMSALVLTRTYVFYTGVKFFRRVYYKPERFNCNRHRPVGALSRLIQVTQHSRNVGFWCLVLFISHDLVWLVLPLASPVMEAIGGTNKTYDELIPEYPSVMPVKVPWLTKEIKYAYDLVVGIINTMPWVGSIVIYYSIVQLIKTQHEILGASLEHRRPIGGDDLEPMNFKLWVEDHVLLRKMMFELKETMSPTLAVTVTVNLLMVGLSMLALISHPVDPHASLTEKFSFYFSFSMYTCSCLCDLFVHCWLSSVLTNCGEVLRTALCKSYLIVNLEHPKDFLLPIMICSKEIKLTAFGMMSVQMQTFTEVLRLSYSYFTLLSSTQA